MKLTSVSIFLIMLLFSTNGIWAQNTWPRDIPTASGVKITMYQPQLENLDGNKLTGRAAVSVKNTATSDPVFGAVWMEGTMVTDRNTRMMELQSVAVKKIKFPGDADSTKLEKLRNLIETELPKWNLTVSLDQVLATLENKNVKQASDLKNDAPKIIYRNQSSLLVFIDGEPKLQDDKNLKMQRVMNSPYPIVKDGNTYYMNAGKFWYSSSSVTTGWTYTTSLSSKVKKLDEQIKKDAAKNKSDKNSATDDTSTVPPAIVVTTEPAELLQTDGDPDYKSLDGTSLLYVANSPNDIFKDINSQNTFVLIAGRWYSAPGISGPWTFVPSDKLPADFAEIKEGGEKDNVLASVAGTNAAEEAKLDAVIPQTAKVDRKTATTNVTYDGNPQFEKISGTNLELAINTSSTVLRTNGKYYVVDNGIWYVGNSASGPWSVSDTRPTDVENIPASSSAYNVKYVQIYETTPSYVVVGYTPGYMNSYIYGPTVVYGTGWYYRPWYGAYYYPRPCTWGFGMSYNPWTGWSVNWGFSWGMGPWSMGYGSSGMYFGFSYGGWFGPPAYFPPYRPPYYGGWYGGGYGVNRPPYYRPGYGNHYGNNNITINNNININTGGNHNLYNKRPGVQSKDIVRDKSMNLAPSKDIRPAVRPGADNKLPGTDRPVTGTRDNLPSRDKNNVFADKSGNVFQRDRDGNWNQQDKGQWKPAPSASNNDLNKMQNSRDRSNTRENMMNNNFNPSSRPSPMSAPAERFNAPSQRMSMPSRPMGGGRRF